MILVLIPLATGHTIQEAVIEGITCQTEAWELMPLSTPALPDKRESEGVSRKLLVERAMNLDLKSISAFCMMDRDVSLMYPEIFTAALKMLGEGVEFVHVRAKARYVPKTHMDIGCFFFDAAEDTLRHLYEAFCCRSLGCWCSHVEQVCQKYGHTQAWLDDAQQAITVG